MLGQLRQRPDLLDLLARRRHEDERLAGLGFHEPPRARRAVADQRRVLRVHGGALPLLRADDRIARSEVDEFWTSLDAPRAVLGLDHGELPPS